MLGTSIKTSELYSPDGRAIPVAASRAVLNRYIQLAAANDEYGIGEMMLAGLIWTVPSGTEVRVISSSEVRILKGKYVGKSCFVASNFVSTW